MSEISMGRSRLYVGLAALAAILYDVLFWKESAGVNFLLLVVVSTLLVTIGLAAAGRLKNAAAFGVAALALAFSASVATYENEFVTWIAPVMAVLLSLVYVGWVSMVTNGLPVYLHQFAFVRHFDEVFSSWKTTLHALAAGREGIVRHILWGLLIAAPLVIIFGLLFSAADPIFADWLKRLNVWESAWRVVRTVVLALLGAGGLYVLTHEKNAATATTPWHWRMAVPTVVVVLVLLNLLFAAFVAIQIKYFFGGASYVLATGLTFADYARNGFFELARVLVIAAIIILFIHRSFAATRSWLVSIFQVAFIAQVGVVAVSALKRMALYQEMYGFTTLRLYVAWFIYLVLAILVFSGVALLARISFRRYALAVTFLGLVAGAGVAFINVDGVIANENITRWAKANKDLDMEYLSKLSLDAVPTLQQLTSDANLSHLTIDQILQFKTYWETKQKAVASTTLLASTWSSNEARQVLAQLPAAASSTFNAAVDLDKEYQKYQGLLSRPSIPYQGTQPCDGWANFYEKTLLQTSAGEISEVNLTDCVLLSANTAAVIVHTDYSEKENKDEYVYVVAEVMPDKGNQRSTLSKILYKKVLFSGVDKYKYGDWRRSRAHSYTIEGDGSLVEGNYIVRRYYRLVLERPQPTGGEYRLLEPKPIY